MFPSKNLIHRHTPDWTTGGGLLLRRESHVIVHAISTSFATIRRCCRSRRKRGSSLKKTGQQRAEVRPEMSDSEVSHVSEAEVVRSLHMESNPPSPHVSIDSPSDRVSLEFRRESSPATEDSAPPIVHPIVSHDSEAEVVQSNPPSPHVSIDSPSGRVLLESIWESSPATGDSAPPIVHPIVDWICPDGRRRWSVVRKSLTIGTGLPFKEGDYHLVVIWLSHVILAAQLHH
jgi:hypothetical protein